MNRRQLTAITQPVFIAVECAHRRYGFVTPMGTVVLTVNSGYE